jgi:hypothetical protein
LYYNLIFIGTRQDTLSLTNDFEKSIK